MDLNAPYELYHILIMTKVLLIDSKKMAELDDFVDDAFFDANMVGPDYYQKLKLIVKEFEKRNWLVTHEHFITVDH